MSSKTVSPQRQSTSDLTSLIKFNYSLDFSVLGTLIEQVLEGQRKQQRDIDYLRSKQSVQESDIKKVKDGYQGVYEQIRSQSVVSPIISDDKSQQDIEILQAQLETMRKDQENKNKMFEKQMLKLVEGSGRETQRQIQQIRSQLEESQGSQATLADIWTRIESQDRLISDLKLKFSLSLLEQKEGESAHEGLFKIFDDLKEEFSNQFMTRADLRNSALSQVPKDLQSQLHEIHASISHFEKDLRDKVDHDDLIDMLGHSQPQVPSLQGTEEEEGIIEEESQPKLELVNTPIAVEDGSVLDFDTNMGGPQTQKHASKQELKVPDQPQIKVVARAPESQTMGRPQRIVVNNSKDSKLVKELASKVMEHEKYISDLKKVVSPSIIKEMQANLEDLFESVGKKASQNDYKRIAAKTDDLLSRVVDMERQLKLMAESDFFGSAGKDTSQIIHMLGLKADKQETKTNKVVQNMNDVIQKVDDQMKLMMVGTGGGTHGSFDNDASFEERMLKDLKTRLESALKEMNNQKTEMMRVQAQMEREVQKRVSQEEFQQQIEKQDTNVKDIYESLNKNFVQKVAFRRQTRYYDKLIQKIQEALGDKKVGSISPPRGPFFDEDNALIAKKPLGGWSCASCGSLQKHPAHTIGEYVPTNLVPARDIHAIQRKGGQGTNFISKIINEELPHPGYRSGAQSYRSIDVSSTPSNYHIRVPSIPKSIRNPIDLRSITHRVEQPKTERGAQSPGVIVSIGVKEMGEIREERVNSGGSEMLPRIS